MSLSVHFCQSCSPYLSSHSVLVSATPHLVFKCFYKILVYCHYNLTVIILGGQDLSTVEKSYEENGHYDLLLNLLISVLGI